MARVRRFERCRVRERSWIPAPEAEVRRILDEGGFATDRLMRLLSGGGLVLAGGWCIRERGALRPGERAEIEA